MEKLSASLVLNHLKTNGELDKFYESILSQLKSTSSYQRLKQVSSMHMNGTLPVSSKNISISEERMKKKKQIAEIGMLALLIDSSMSAILSEHLQNKAGLIITNAIKEILKDEAKNLPETLVQAPKRLLEAREIARKNALRLDKESFNRSMNAFLENNDSVTISGTDKKVYKNGEATSKQNNNQKPVKLAGPKRKISQEAKDKQTQKLAIESADNLRNQKRFQSDKSSQGVPKKRNRKPNSKYASKNFLLSNEKNSRVQEMLDVQRDLNIINGVSHSGNDLLPAKKKSKQ